jgi:hypothetical protein
MFDNESLRCDHEIPGADIKGSSTETLHWNSVHTRIKAPRSVSLPYCHLSRIVLSRRGICFVDYFRTLLDRYDIKVSERDRNLNF